jgi:hypothetical protein
MGWSLNRYLQPKKIMPINIHPISSRRRIINQPNPMQHKIISFWTQTTTIGLEEEKLFFISPFLKKLG